MAMPPWEQYASFASALPRFNYNAASTVSSLRGFLITCTLDREKSATKEAIGFLQKYLKRPSLTVDHALQSSSAGEQKAELDQYAEQGQVFPVDTECASILQVDTVQERQKEIVRRPLAREVDTGNASEDKACGENTSLAAITDSSHYVSSPLTSSKLVEITPPVGNNSSQREDTNGREITREEEMTVRAMKSNACSDPSKQRWTFKECQAAKARGREVCSKRSRAGHSDSASEDLSCFFVLKMAQKGIVSLFLENGYSDDAVKILSDVLEDMENGVREPPQ